MPICLLWSRNRQCCQHNTQLHLSTFVSKHASSCFNVKEHTGSGEEEKKSGEIDSKNSET